MHFNQYVLKELALPGLIYEVPHANVYHLKMLPRLRSLDLSNCNQAHLMIAFIASLTKLTYLNVARTSVDDRDITEVAQFCTGLTSLNLSDTSIADDGLRALGTYCPRIKHITLLKMRREINVSMERLFPKWDQNHVSSRFQYTSDNESDDE